MLNKKMFFVFWVKSCFYLAQLRPRSINGMNTLPLLLILGYNLTYMDNNTAKKNNKSGS